MKLASRALLLFSFTLPFTLAHAAQPAASEPAAQRSVASSMNEDLGFIEQEVLGVAKVMPADRYNFSPAELGIQAADFGGVRSFAAEAKHIAMLNYIFFSGIGGPKPDVDPASIDKLTTKEDIVAALGKSFEYAHRCVATLTPENMAQPAPGPGNPTRISLAAFAMMHSADHYGQMVEYLRMNGYTPQGGKK